MLAAHNAQKTLGGTHILRGISLGVHPGEVLAIIGPNGAGKSTLLHALSAATDLDGGTVEMDGRPLAQWSRQELALKRAVLAQTPVLTFPFRVLDVVMLGRSPHAGRVESRRDWSIVDTVLRETDVAHLADRIYTTLSGGERQRVQLARVLAQIWPDPHSADGAQGRYLLLDEPTNNLDIAHQQAIMVTARRFAAQGNGVVAVLHDPNLASIYADRICVLRDGRVVADGAPSDVMTNTLFEETFGLPVAVLAHPNHDRPVMLPI